MRFAGRNLALVPGADKAQGAEAKDNPRLRDEHGVCRRVGHRQVPDLPVEECCDGAVFLGRRGWSPKEGLGAFLSSDSRLNELC